MATTLRRKMILSTAALIASVLAITGGSLFAVRSILTNLEQASDEYEELRLVERLDVHIASARGNLLAQTPNLRVVSKELREAIELLGAFVAMQPSQDASDTQHQGLEASHARALVDRLGQTVDDLEQADQQKKALTEQSRHKLLSSVSQVLDQANQLLEAFGKTIKQGQARAQRTLRKAVAMVGILSSLIGLMGVLISLAQYRSVVGPLSRLREGARRAASGDLAHRVEIEGDQEFVDLAQDFNHMTTQLKTIYQELEQRVSTKSKELVRSERLASVGYLAAGVAHEINNPLNIISGYAEILLKQQSRAKGTSAAADPTQELRIIRDESFRCKQIIEKLLSLTRGSSVARQTVDITLLVYEVTSIVAGLKKYQNRAVDLDFPANKPLLVDANEAEMKQVLLNLTINALEAVDPHQGRICIRGRHDNGYVTVCVEDNGCGMTPQTIDKVFEPFFTTRHDQGQQGTGLGLSIVHAIITDHGGQIEAHSDGPGRGSRFTVRLPHSRPTTVNRP